MELLGSVVPVPTDVSIAGEHFGMSSHETDLVVTTAATAPARRRCGASAVARSRRR